MPGFHLLRCMVGLGGSDDTQVYRDRTRPIVFPELPILQYLHGEEAITEVFVVGQWNAPNEEVLGRLQNIYASEVIQAVFPGARPRLPLSDPSIPRCTLPIYRPRSPRPENPDPRLRPLAEFTEGDRPVVEAPPLTPEDEPTPDEIAAHAQDHDDDDDMGLVPDNGRPRPEDQPHIVRDTLGRGSSRSALAPTLPDVNAGGSHSPTFEDKRPRR
jgi:hypothetical protein